MRLAERLPQSHSYPGHPTLGRLRQQFGPKIGTSAYAPLPESAEITVFNETSQIKRPYKVIGIISYDNPGKFRILTLGDAIEPLKEKAREVGANGIIIDKSQPVKSGIISTGI